MCNEFVNIFFGILRVDISWVRFIYLDRIQVLRILTIFVLKYFRGTDDTPDYLYNQTFTIAYKAIECCTCTLFN